MVTDLHHLLDRRRRHLTIVQPACDIVITNETAAALRALPLLDPHCERLVFGIRAHYDDAVLSATGEDLEDLIGAVAAEATRETSRRRHQRLDAALDALTDAATEGR